MLLEESLISFPVRIVLFLIYHAMRGKTSHTELIAVSFSYSFQTIVLEDVNNRGFIFVVTNNQGEKHLLMSGLPTDKCIAKAQKVEKVTGLSLSLIVSSGDAHHMALRDWLVAFPNTQFVMPGLKFPKTRNGKEILGVKSYADRIELANGPDFPTLEQYSDTVQFFGFNQFFHAEDAEFTSKDIHNTSKLPKFQFLKNFGGLKANVKFLCIWAYHVPTKQLIYEHNFGFYLTKEHHKQFGLPFSLILPKEKICSVAKEQIPAGPRDFEEIKEHCRQMSKIVTLDVRAMMEYHSLPGVMAAQFNGQKEFQHAFINILKATGEDDVTGEAMYRVMNRRCFCF